MTTYSYRSSFSQHNLFMHCPRSWYNSAILKWQIPSDMCHANAGNAIHKTLELFYSKKITTIDETKVEFEKQWEKYSLAKTKLSLERDTYWLMVLNGIQLQKTLTSTEMTIFYPEIIAHIDGVDSTNDELIDWKSSKRSPDNEEEYKLQLRLYAWLYYRKFGRIPNNCTVHYLRYPGSKGQLSFKFTEQDIKDAEQWYYDILQKMEDYIKDPKTLPPYNTNYHWSPYKDFWGTEGNGTLIYTIHLYGNHLQLEGPVTPLLEVGIKKKFSYELKNSVWIKKARPWARTKVEFWNSTARTLPIGFKDALVKTLQDYAEHKQVGLTIDVKEHRVFDTTKVLMPSNFINGKTLREYQIDTVDIYLRKKIGILQLATGAGKTEVAIECIRRLGVKTLFIVDKIELLRQTRTRISESLGITVGQIGQGVCEIEDVTVATVQTLNKKAQELASYLSSVRFVIFDETHKVAAASYAKISRKVQGAEYRMGLSGTAFRDDGNDMMIHAVAGNIIHSISSTTLIEKGWLVKPTIIFHKDYMEKGLVPLWEQESKDGLINESIHYAKYYDKFIVNNQYRNNKIVEIVNTYTDRKVLILTKLIEHGDMLMKLLPGSKHLYGGTNKKEREEMFNKFVHGDDKILISTIPIWSEGLDCKPLGVIVNAGANVGSIKTIQMLGRILRPDVGKTTAIYIDFIDETKFFRLASSKRKKVLEREGHTIDVI